MATVERRAAQPQLRPGTVPEQLRSVLRALREEGLSFEAAWPEALHVITWPVSKRETVEWERALAATREAWCSTYEGWHPLPHELAAAGLPDLLAAARLR